MSKYGFVSGYTHSSISKIKPPSSDCVPKCPCGSNVSFTHSWCVCHFYRDLWRTPECTLSGEKLVKISFAFSMRLTSYSLCRWRWACTSEPPASPSWVLESQTSSVPFYWCSGRTQARVSRLVHKYSTYWAASPALTAISCSLIGAWF